MKGKMTMKKDKINVKETENKDAAPLCDGDLESAVGGGNVLYELMRMECYMCGMHGHWTQDYNFAEHEKLAHESTGHLCRIFRKRVDDSFDFTEEIPSFSDGSWSGPYNA